MAPVAVVFLEFHQSVDVGVEPAYNHRSSFPWRLSSATLSAPRQSRVPDGPHGPLVELEVVSTVVK